MPPSWRKLQFAARKKPRTMSFLEHHWYMGINSEQMSKSHQLRTNEKKIIIIGKRASAQK
jgi:hypothetical protein